MNAKQAQQLVHQIESFRNEVQRLRRQGLDVIRDDCVDDLEEHHQTLLGKLEKEFLVDRTASQARLSLGIRIATALGAVALSLGFFFLFRRYWGYLSTPIQVTLLLIGPCLSAWTTLIAMRRDQTGYYASLFGLLTLTLFILNLYVIAQIFNVFPSHQALLVWAAASLILAYTFNFRLLLYAGLLCFLGFLSAEVGTWSGCYWVDFGEQPENFLLAGTAILAGAWLPAQRDQYHFPVAYKVVGLITLFISILILSNYGRASYLSWPNDFIEASYQIFGFTLWGFFIYFGLKRHDNYFVNLGVTFFTIQLYTKVFDWFWEWMPKYLFFFLVAGIFILALVILKRLRGWKNIGSES